MLEYAVINTPDKKASSRPKDRVQQLLATISSLLEILEEATDIIDIVEESRLDALDEGRDVGRDFSGTVR